MNTMQESELKQIYKSGREVYEINSSSLFTLGKVYLMMLSCSKDKINQIKNEYETLKTKQYTIEELKKTFDTSIEKFRLIINYNLIIKKNLNYFYELEFLNAYLMNEDKFINFNQESICGNKSYFFDLSIKIYWEVLDFLDNKFSIYQDKNTNKNMKFGHFLTDQIANSLYDSVEAFVLLENPKSNIGLYLENKQYDTLNAIIEKYFCSLIAMQEKIELLKSEV